MEIQKKRINFATANLKQRLHKTLKTRNNMKTTEKIIIEKMNFKPGRGRNLETLQILAVRKIRREQKTIDIRLLTRCETLRYITGTY